MSWESPAITPPIAERRHVRARTPDRDLSIGNVLLTDEAVGAGGVRQAEDRLAGILNAEIRGVLGSEGVTSNTILSSDRAALMVRIRELSQARAAALGLEIVDVRLKQTNLPDQNLDATFARMRAEREREAADEIARGEEADHHRRHCRHQLQGRLDHGLQPRGCELGDIQRSRQRQHPRRQRGGHGPRDRKSVV